MEHLKFTIEKMDGALTEKHNGVNICIADNHYKMPKKAPTPTAKKLLLSSGQNAVAEYIKRYIRLHYQSKIIEIMINFSK